ncbi:hypothetical protein DFAR_3060034 [Desulfarculales bacterium]
MVIIHVRPVLVGPPKLILQAPIKEASREVFVGDLDHALRQKSQVDPRRVLFRILGHQLLAPVLFLFHRKSPFCQRFLILQVRPKLGEHSAPQAINPISHAHAGLR